MIAGEYAWDEEYQEWIWIVQQKDDEDYEEEEYEDDEMEQDYESDWDRQTGWIAHPLGVHPEVHIPLEPFKEARLFSLQSQEMQPRSTFLNDQIPMIDLRRNPTYVIMGLGCTRSMGSRRAVEAFVKAAAKFGITCEWKRCWTKMSFANSKTAWLEWCVVVTFPTVPPVTTTIDVHEKGDIPLLLSLQQMMNLGFTQT